MSSFITTAPITSQQISDISWLLTRSLVKSRKFYLYLLAFLIPGVVFSIIDAELPILLFGAFIERILQLLVIAALIKNAVQLLPIPRKIAFNSRFFIVGFAIELILTSGVFLIVALPGGARFLAALALVLSVRILLRHILYPMPMLDKDLDWRASLAASRALTTKVSLISLSLWPLAFFMLGSGLAFCVYPDGRLWWSSPAAHLFAAAAHLIFAVRCTAASLLATGLEYKPHGRARFGSARVLAISGIILWAANFIRAYTLAPGPSIKIIELVVLESNALENKVTLTLEATDKTYQFRGFTPQRFFIGGKTGYPVTGMPVKITGASETSDFNPDAGSATPDTKRFTLEFLSKRKAQELAELEDLQLWYGAAVVQPVQMILLNDPNKTL